MGMTDRAVRASDGTTSAGATALAWTGLIHTAYGLLAYWPVWALIAGDGVFNAIGSSPRPERDAALWFLVSGVLLIVVGRTAGLLHRTTRNGSGPGGLERYRNRRGRWDPCTGLGVAARRGIWDSSGRPTAAGAIVESIAGRCSGRRRKHVEGPNGALSYGAARRATMTAHPA